VSLSFRRAAAATLPCDGLNTSGNGCRLHIVGRLLRGGPIVDFSEREALDSQGKFVHKGSLLRVVLCCSRDRPVSKKKPAPGQARARCLHVHDNISHRRPVSTVPPSTPRCTSPEPRRRFSFTWPAPGAFPDGLLQLRCRSSTRSAALWMRVGRSPQRQCFVGRDDVESWMLWSVDVDCAGEKQDRRTTMADGDATRGQLACKVVKSGEESGCLGADGDQRAGDASAVPCLEGGGVVTRLLQDPFSHPTDPSIYSVLRLLSSLYLSSRFSR